MPLVQSAKKDIKAVNNTTLAFPSPLTAGNLVVASIVTFQSTAGTTITTPTDTLGHTYVPVLAQQNTTPNTVHLRSWYVQNNLAGADTITADISGTGTGEITVIISEWSGLATSDVLTGTPVASGPTPTTAPSTGAITPAHSGSLLMGVLNAGGGGFPTTITPAVGWATVQEYEGGNSSVTLSVIFKMQTNATPEAASWSVDPSVTCLSHIMAFKPAPVVAPPSSLLYGTLALQAYGR